MKKKEKQKDKKIKKVELTKSNISQIDSRFEITAKIEELENFAQNSYLKGEYRKAISYAEEIIRLAIQGDVQSYVKEQEKFINVIADKLQKEYVISEIKNTAMGMQSLYETLIKMNKVKKAHEIVKDFKKRYEDIPEFDSIPLVQEIIMKDNKEWIKHTSREREDLVMEPVEEIEEEDIDSMVDEIQRFLKTR